MEELRCNSDSRRPIDNYLMALKIPSLSPHQEKALEIIKLKKDLFIILPTGSGKSLCFQLAPIVTGTNQCVIVVMPLTALIHQQIATLKSICLRPEHLTTADQAIDCLTTDGVTHLFMSPEFLCDTFTTILRDHPVLSKKVSHIFIDETHCITSWGQSDKRSKAFRHKFSQIGEFRTFVPHAAYVAMTATATKEMEDTVSTSLKMDAHHTIRLSPEKPNIRYSVVNRRGGIAQCFNWLVEEFNHGIVEKTLVFFKDLHYIGEAFEYLRERCPGAIAMFHSRISEAGKRSITERFTAEECCELKVVLCSTAFSMGMDIKDVRRVVHFGVPSDLPQYVQETGRAGRDGKQARAIIIRHRYALSGSSSISSDMKKYLNMKDGCRREALVSAFGEVTTVPKQFWCCDLCPTHCCSCAAAIECNHSDKHCFCLSNCSLTTLEKPSPKSKAVICRTPASTTAREDLECALNELRSTHTTVPDNVSSIYPELIRNIISQATTIETADHIRELGAYNLSDARNILDILEQFFPKGCDLDTCLTQVTLTSSESDFHCSSSCSESD